LAPASAMRATLQRRWGGDLRAGTLICRRRNGISFSPPLRHAAASSSPSYGDALYGGERSTPRRHRAGVRMCRSRPEPTACHPDISMHRWVWDVGGVCSVWCARATAHRPEWIWRRWSRCPPMRFPSHRD
jgi:hypothetical protein